MRARLPRAAGAFLVMSLLAVGAAAMAADEPLHLEDVVRMHVRGVPAETIVDTIRRSPVEFDVSTEMLAELRVAGIPESVIAAIVARQTELHPPAPPPEVTEPATTASLHIRVDVPTAKNGSRLPLRIAKRLSPSIAEAAGLDPDARIEDAAVWIACLTPTHVPDHWRAASPLGRDFVSMPRHRLLAFVPGAVATKKGDALELAVPETIDAPLGADLGPAADDPHDLSFGIAVNVDGRWLRVTSVERKGKGDEASRGELAVEVVPSRVDLAATKLTWVD